jgi:hypothetical protein
MHPTEAAMRQVPSSLTTIPAQIGVWITMAGFGLLALDAAVGVIAIPAGIALALAGMPRRDRR